MLLPIKYSCVIPALSFAFSVAAAQTAAVPTPATSTQAAAAPRTTPRDRLVYAAEQASLETLITPWHLKLDVTVYDDKGENPQNGTIEYWQNADTKLSVFTFGAASQRVLALSDKNFESKTDAEIPNAAALVLGQFLHPGPYVRLVDISTLISGKQKFGNADLDCVMLEPKSIDNPVSLGSFSTYCLSHETDVLRVSYRKDSNSLIRNQVETVMGKRAALEITLARGDLKVATAKAIELASFTPPDAFFEPDSTMKEVSRTAKISGGVVAGLKLSGDPVQYPAMAKQRRVGGTVVLHAFISKEGNIRALTVVSSPDPDLTDAAMKAVRTYKYRPYLMLGKPVEVDTTISINFDLRS